MPEVNQNTPSPDYHAPPGFIRSSPGTSSLPLLLELIKSMVLNLAWAGLEYRLPVCRTPPGQNVGKYPVRSLLPLATLRVHPRRHAIFNELPAASGTHKEHGTQKG